MPRIKNNKTDYNNILNRFRQIRNQTETIAGPLKIEDCVVQPELFVSPPKWHLAHTTWFFETLVLKKFLPHYKVFNPQFDFLFNSYYNALGKKLKREKRGFLTRPEIDEVYKYREYVNQNTERLFEEEIAGIEDAAAILELGLQHEQQHQELLWYDIKYILGTQPFFPAYGIHNPLKREDQKTSNGFVYIKGGDYTIGYQGKGFCYDNELEAHEVKVRDFSIARCLVTVGDYLEFVQSGGYEKFEYWHDDGWSFINDNGIKAPLYWVLNDEELEIYTLCGLQKATLQEPVNHLSYYEAAAFAKWKGCRLPTEHEWEAAADKLNYGMRWEWTESAYLPYPGFREFEGEAAEYNGKFMVNQKVLRGGSEATPINHFRKTYRNFFHPEMRWMFSGLRLVKN